MTGNIMWMQRKKKSLWRAYSVEKYYTADNREYQIVQKEVKKQIWMVKRKLERSRAKKAKK